MAKYTFVKSARKDVAGTDIKKGESYYWWKFRYGSKKCSRTKPTRSQLTQSNFLSQLYDIEDKLSDFSCEDEDTFNAFKEEIMGEIEVLKDETQDSFDNIPEQLQSAPTGEFLQERIDALEQWYEEIDCIDCNIDEEEIREEITTEEEENELPEEEIQERVDEKIKEKFAELSSELSCITHNL